MRLLAGKPWVTLRSASLEKMTQEGTLRLPVTLAWISCSWLNSLALHKLFLSRPVAFSLALIVQDTLTPPFLPSILSVPGAIRTKGHRLFAIRRHLLVTNILTTLWTLLLPQVSTRLHAPSPLSLKLATFPRPSFARTLTTPRMLQCLCICIM